MITFIQAVIQAIQAAIQAIQAVYTGYTGCLYRLYRQAIQAIQAGYTGYTGWLYRLYRQLYRLYRLYRRMYKSDHGAKKTGYTAYTARALSIPLLRETPIIDGKCRAIVVLTSVWQPFLMLKTNLKKSENLKI